MSEEWPHGDSPFHEGELAAQERVGVRDKIEPFARRVVRDHMPGQHREFYAQLPFVLLGTVDDKGRPWASLVAGRPGFMTSPDERSLHIGAPPLAGDPLNETLQEGALVGLLGIEPMTRRRNRMTGKITAIENGGFGVAVTQAFGNCPQYIQSRAVTLLPEIDTPAVDRPVHRGGRFDQATRELIERSDTLFIATAYTADPDSPSQGADVSHRGGKPGFVRVDDDRTFVVPDFSGNFHFNTIGNIVQNPRAGFLFVDFETRDVVYMTGAAEIIWDGDDVTAFAGAERLIRFRLDELIRVETSLPLAFDFDTYSPVLDHTGSWEKTAETIAAEKERNTYIPYEICDVRPESDVITSFYLRRADGKAPARHEPGQFLPIRLAIPGQDEPALRTYTLSDAPDGATYRLSIKKEGGTALVSNHLHDNAAKGFRLEAMAPRGKFVLDQSSDRPVVLISGGVGITPMMAMANFIIAEGKRTRAFRPTYFIHGAQNGRLHAFGDHIRQLAAEHEAFNAHVRYSQPSDDDAIGVTHDSEGFVDVDLLKALLPFDDYDFYLCGPGPFMQSLYDGLTGLGVSDERIHYESFGPATVLKHDTSPKPMPAPGEAVDGPVSVNFAASDVTATWSPDSGTLLELAEAAGLNPNYACRSGVCGTCATRIKCGSVDYVEEPSAPRADDEVLICCATPRSETGEASCGNDLGVVLDL